MNGLSSNRKTSKPVLFREGRLALLSVVLACCWGAGAVYGQPFGPQVITGQASFMSQGNTLIVTNSPKTIIDWQGFSIAADELTRFNQQNSSSAVLNRVVGGASSAILGALQSNGQIYLINPSGILIGPGARIDVAGLIASTLDLSNQDFLAGRYQFNAASQAGKLDNQGSITTPAGGHIYLIAPNLENSGILTSPKGDILLAAGHRVYLVDSADPSLQVVVSAPDHQALNLGQIIAASGRVGIYGALVGHRGQISADSAVVGENGKIVFKASRDTRIDGSVSATGTGLGGEIQVLGERVAVLDGARLDASGQRGGGTLLVGGDYQGNNPEIQNAQRTYVAPHALLKADALDQGDGGKVIVWSAQATRAYGSLSAQGGPRGGKGGLVETSGHYLDVAGIKVTSGVSGTWLLDPYDIEVVESTGSTVLTDFDEFSDPPTSGISQVSNTAISDSAAPVTLQASHDITVAAPIAMTEPGVALTMRANNEIRIDNSVSTAGGTITLSAGEGYAQSAGSGILSLAPSRTVASHGGAIVISAGDIDLQGSLQAGSGDVTLSSVNSRSIGLGSGEREMNIANAELANIAAANLNITASGSDIEVQGVAEADVGGIGKVVLSGGRVFFSNSPTTFKTLTVNADDGIFIDTDIATTSGNLELDSNANFVSIQNPGLSAYDEIGIQYSVTLSAAGQLIFGKAGRSGYGGNVDAGSDDLDYFKGDIALSGDQGITFHSGYIQSGSGYTATLTAAAGTIDAASINAGKNTLIVNGNLTAGSGTLELSAKALTLSGTASAATLKIVNTNDACQSGYACDIGLGAAALFTGEAGIMAIDPAQFSADSVRLEARGGSIDVRGVTVPWNTELLALTAGSFGGSILFSGSASSFGSLSAQASGGVFVHVPLTTTVGGMLLDGATAWDASPVNTYVNIDAGSDVDHPTTLTAASFVTLRGERVQVVGDGAVKITAQSGDLLIHAADGYVQAGSGRTTLEAASGGIVVNSSGIDISAEELVLKAAQGVSGSNDQAGTLHTAVSRLQVENSGSGEIAIENNLAGGLELAHLDGSAGGYAVYQGGGDLAVATAVGQSLTLSGKVLASGSGDLAFSVRGSDATAVALSVENQVKHSGSGSISLADSGTYSSTPPHVATLAIAPLAGQHSVETAAGNITLKSGAPTILGTLKAGSTNSDVYDSDQGAVIFQPRNGLISDWQIGADNPWVAALANITANRVTFAAGSNPLTLGALDLSGATQIGYLEFTTVCNDCLVPSLNMTGAIDSPSSLGFVSPEVNLYGGASITSGGFVNLVADTLNIHPLSGNVSANGVSNGAITIAPYTASKGVAVALVNPGGIQPPEGECWPHGCGGAASDLWLDSAQIDKFLVPHGNLQIGWQTPDGTLTTGGDIVFYDPLVLTQVEGLALRLGDQGIVDFRPGANVSAPQRIAIRSGSLVSVALLSSPTITVLANSVDLGEMGGLAATSGVSIAPYDYTDPAASLTVGSGCSSSLLVCADQETSPTAILVNPALLSRVITYNLDLGHGSCDSGGNCAVDFAGEIIVDAPIGGSLESFKNLGLLTLGAVSQSAAGTITLPECAGCGGLAVESHSGGIELDYAANSVSNLAAYASGNIYFWNNKTLTIANAVNVHGIKSNGGNIQLYVDNGDLVVGGSVPGVAGYYSGIDACPISGACGDVYLESDGAIRGILGTSSAIVASRFGTDTRNGVCSGLSCGTVSASLPTQVAQLELYNRDNGHIKVVNNSVSHSQSLEIIQAENHASDGGGVFIDNFGPTVVGYEDITHVTHGGSVSATSGPVAITAHSPLTVYGGSTVNAAGNITLVAAQGSGDNNTLSLNGTISSSGGTVALSAYNSVTIAPTTSVSAGGSGTITVVATTGGITATGATLSVPPGSPPISLTAGTTVTGAPLGATVAENTLTPQVPTITAPTLSQCTASPTLSGCAGVLPTLAQCTASPATPGCTAVLPSLAECAANPAQAGCSAVLPTTSQCTTNPGLDGCAAVLPTLGQCVANPALAGCSAVLPSVGQCTATPTLAGCNAVLPTLAQCTANPALTGCSAVLPSTSLCASDPALPGCASVLPTLGQCVVNPALSGCNAVLPSLVQCAANPALDGCAAVLPTLAQCVANPAQAGCTAVLPSTSLCTANPALAGCSAVLPTLVQCVANPTLAGCGTILPSMELCTANPTQPGCAAVLPTLGQCLASPTLAGCATVLPSTAQCAAEPALPGCSGILPSLGQCTANPALAGCNAVLPSTALCAANPTLPGCTAVLPTLAQCTANPALAGCSAVLPSTAHCATNPGLAGCPATPPPPVETDPCIANPALLGCTPTPPPSGPPPGESAPLEQALNQTNNTINSNTSTSATQPLTGQGGTGTQGGTGNTGTAGQTASATQTPSGDSATSGSDDKEDKKESRRDSAKRGGASAEDKKNEPPSKKQYCN